MRRTILVIPDLHEPFSSEGYRNFVEEVADVYSPEEVVFIGDVIDNHFASYHETELDALSAQEEIKKTLQRVNKWYQMFPDAYVIEGNHDRIIDRKAKTAKVPKEWIKSYNEVLETPNWKWKKDLVIDGIYFVHGEGPHADKTALAKGMPTVQGHKHSLCFVKHLNNNGLWGCQVGVGIDRDSYAMRYSKNDPREYTEGVLVIIDGDPQYITRYAFSRRTEDYIDNTIKGIDSNIQHTPMEAQVEAEAATRVNLSDSIFEHFDGRGLLTSREIRDELVEQLGFNDDLTINKAVRAIREEFPELRRTKCHRDGVLANYYAFE